MHPQFIEHVMEFVVGMSLVLMISYDVFHSIIVPRVSSQALRIAPFLIGRVLWPNFRNLANKLPDGPRDGLLDMFAPMGFVVLLLTWFLLLILGYACMIYACGHFVKPNITDFSDAIYFAGTSVLTLGFGDIVASTWQARILVLSAAVLGLVFLALEVSLLFSLQSYLQMREQVVTTLFSRAGRPASGVVLLLRYRELNIVPSLSGSYVGWETWLATVLESHRTYPLLVYFRSSSKAASWFSTMGALLDAATLLTTCIDDVHIGEAELFYWLGTTTLKSICEYFDLQPAQGISMTKEQFDQGCYLLESAGFQLRDHQRCYPSFNARRTSYMRFLTPIAEHFALNLQTWAPDLAGESQE
ncbi:MAG TPA: potassium channel family protein [Planktothrix sp.]|jgi:hypothetical protein